MKVICAILIWILMSGLGFVSLPLLQQTGANLGFVVISVLSGPIVGTISILTSGANLNAYLTIIFGFVICASGILWYLKRRTLLSFLIASLSWTITGLLLSVGIYV